MPQRKQAEAIIEHEDYLVPGPYYELPGGAEPFPVELRGVPSLRMLELVMTGHSDRPDEPLGDSVQPAISKLPPDQRERVFQQIFTHGKLHMLGQVLQMMPADEQALAAGPLLALDYDPLTQTVSNSDTDH